ncbi:MAG: FKBP-type peptidyl-prolyl cis-trans isomerase [Candidatus Marinimicrobia bacterium]|nr:FKBP-type peptidyl-prolyl cis-trans isomerase [Candidatus Neomarinimicrobiota bacterium]
MRNLLLIGIGLIFFACSGSNQETGEIKLKNRQDSISYSIGMDIGNGMQTQFIEIDPNLLHQGFVSGYNKEDGLISEAERQNILNTYQQELRGIQAEKRKGIAENNLSLAEDFLSTNEKKAGVVVLPSGLQYKIITEGSGPTTGPDDKVKVHYRGTLLDGKEFDSSYSRGEPATFSPTQVIKGWSEALQMMPVGSKWELYIHPSLGYGDRGSRNIEPNSALIFEVEVLEIVK